MKKIIALLAAVCMTLTLTACSSADVAEVLDFALNELDAVLTEGEGDTQDAPEAVDEDADTETDEDRETPTEDTESTGSDAQSADYSGGDFTLDEDGSYTTSEDVALYIVTYNHLPDNFMTKEEARELGWTGGGLDDYAYGMCIGGDYFGNKEGILPKEKGRTYHECDIDTLHANQRGAERIVYSNDGLVYYTNDHYETFTLLYGEE